jgi:hypothetical protein
MNKIEDIREKLIAFGDKHIAYANEDGNSYFNTCNYSGWDADIWHHKHSIMDYIRSKGFTVTSKTNHGVLDISIVKSIKLI